MPIPFSMPFFDSFSPAVSRRTLLRMSAAGSAALALGAQAQSVWPTKPVTMIVPWAPAGSNDITARLLAPALESRFRQPFVVENRPGAGSAIGNLYVAQARPDGRAGLGT